MVNQKKYILCGSLTALFCFYTIGSQKTDTDFNLAELSIEIPDDLEQEQAGQEIDAALTKDCPNILTPFQVVSELTSSTPSFGKPIEIQNILQFNLYRRTNPPITRSLNDLPSLRPLIFCAPCWGIGVDVFFNKTGQQFFTCNSRCLGSYIDLLTNDDFLDLIDEKDFTSLDIPTVLPLLAGATLEERRLGAMISGWKKINCCLFSATLPAYYFERNLFLSEKRQEQLEQAALFMGTGNSSPLPSINSSTFTHQHLVSDQAGIGDLRLQGFYEAVQNECHRLDIGAQVTFPTARTVARGINGGTFCLLNPLPLIDFYRMFNLAICAETGDKQAALELKELVVDYGLLALDRLTGNVANTNLGQGHVTLGPLMHGCHQLAPCLGFEWWGELEASAPANEVRLFNVKKNAAEFDRDYTNEADAQQNLNFLMEQARNTLYPTAVIIKTTPGLILKAQAALTTQVNTYHAAVGYDIWSQQPEKLNCVRIRITPGGPLDFAAGRKYAAFEGKIFADLGTQLEGSWYNFRTTLRTDVTVQNKGIGRSFTIGINIAGNF